ncbi:MAG: hypothetical protein Q4F66_03980 [Clostridium sp.]|nr:hypothetical protein [Clostridium sp.]
MNHDECKCEKHILKKILWGTIAAAAFLKAIEGPNHIAKRKNCHKKKKNKIIYIYK